MDRFGMRCLALIIVPLVLSVTLACDDDDELVCCQCTCYTVINPVLGTEEENVETISGKGISCEAECRNTCDSMNWDIRYHAKVNCPKGGTNEDTSQQ